MSSSPSLNPPSTTYTEGGDRGVDSGKTQSALDAFTEYKTDIANTFSGFKSQITGYASAFYGDSSNQVKAYVDGVIDSCQSLMESLNAFESKIDEAAANYAAQASTIYGGMGTNASAGGE